MSRPGWMDRAACAGLDTELFFPVGNQDPAQQALTACQSCPVHRDCLTYSLGPHGAQVEKGVWAGMGEAERANEKRKRLRRGDFAA